MNTSQHKRVVSVRVRRLQNVVFCRRGAALVDLSFFNNVLKRMIRGRLGLVRPNFQRTNYRLLNKPTPDFQRACMQTFH